MASSDVCKDDEWSYLCNTDAWAGAADAVSGGEELQTAALRRALAATTGGAPCVATDAACIATKAIVDAKLLNIPKVVNSDVLAQVNKDAGLIHPAAHNFVLSAKTPAVYTGSTLTVTAVGPAPTYVDTLSLVKIVDASVKNGCDNGDAATNNAGHKDVRSTATVLGAAGGCTDTSKAGLGRKICLAAGGTFSFGVKFNFGFAFTDVNTPPASAIATTWRLCLVRTLWQMK